MNLNPLAKITKANMRTGTKFVILNFIVTMFIVLFVNVIIPVLAIWFPVMVEVISRLQPSAVTVALLGQSGVASAANSIRIAIENKAKKGVQALNDNASRGPAVD